ncbi:hypothetical protein D1BOALGB6SA_9802 [Olavius sp. associated proteobacterium Delta 1]|nr:hypothetical protein D1BOALGB6SA_9802 [Olavius sp. associated proteobacterium Delta 1]
MIDTITLRLACRENKSDINYFAPGNLETITITPILCHWLCLIFVVVYVIILNLKE